VVASLIHSIHFLGFSYAGFVVFTLIWFCQFFVLNILLQFCYKYLVGSDCSYVYCSDYMLHTQES